MFVRVESMLNGVGTAMMHEAVRLARSHGAEHLWLIADPNAGKLGCPLGLFRQRRRFPPHAIRRA